MLLDRRYGAPERLGDASSVAARFNLETFQLGNRRYLGGKSKLIGFIHQQVFKSLSAEPSSFFDVFAGTGVVAEFYAGKGIRVIANDLLFHNFLGLLTFLAPQKLDLASLAKKIIYLQGLAPRKNYFSQNFGGTYFSERNAQLIGRIRAEIEIIANTRRERAALITSLIYAADRVANTVGHYDAFHRNSKNDKPLQLKLPVIPRKLAKENRVHHTNALLLAPKVHTEVAYLDPPYNSRQYSDAYHLLENLAGWKKPVLKGVAKKFDRSGIKSDFCGKKAPLAFDKLIQSINANLILVSYNNTMKSLVPRSNAAISDEFIMETLRKRGKVTIEEMNFGAFTTGRSKQETHKERIFICSVKK